jgi:ParB/RepB/Spo0J family partition protein
MSRLKESRDAHGPSRPSPDPSIPRRGPARLLLTKLRHPTDPHRQKLDAERVAALASDIAANGLLNPILVRGPMLDGAYEIIAGDRRTYAHELLGRLDIEAFIYPADTDPLDIRAAENSQTESLSPMEQARVCARYQAKGLPLAHIALKLGHNAAWVRDRLALLTYPDDVAAAIDAGTIPLTVAAALVEIDHDGVRGEYLAEAIRSGANSKTVDVWLAHWRQDGARMAANHDTIRNITENRDKYILKVRCQGCHEEVPLMDTQTFRFCRACVETIFAGTEVAERG